MKIFISWSGELSHNVAKDLKDWLSCVLQGVNSFVSSEDIRKGQRWAIEVAKELDESNFGIVCLTKENLNAPWILFEAGALSKSVKESNVSALLINSVEMSDITPPLSQFQHTTTSKEDLQKLVMTINDKLGEKRLPDETIKRVFEKWYPDLKEKIRLNIENTDEGESTFEKRSEREIIVETLELARFIANRVPSGFMNLDPDRGDLITSDGVLISPSGGDYNHPSEVKIFPVPIIKDGITEKLVSVKVTSSGVEINKITPPFDTRGVIIILTFWSETEGKYWRAKFQFHKGNTLIETEMDDTEELGEDENYRWDAIWRD